MNLVFPASYSTLSPSALASLIENKYELKNIDCQFLLRGVGDTYLVESATAHYILRVYRSSHRSLSEVQAETELLLALTAANIPVSYPIPDSSGAFIQTLEAVEGSRHAVLFTYAPGHSVSLLNEDQLSILGHQMARFHNGSSTIKLSHDRWKIDLTTTLFNPLKIVAPLFAGNPEDLAWWEQAAKQIESRLAHLQTGNFSTGYCHYDFLPKNFHFEGGDITFFDFDFLGYGWLVHDIMTFWIHLALETHFGRMTQEAADNAYAIFVAAYREYRPVSEAELAAVPLLWPGFLLHGTAFHSTHDQFYPFIQPGQLKMRTALSRQLFDRYCTPIAK
jgi:Ser/Thr protein kinase RdoA (MazF antagonist)